MELFEKLVGRCEIRGADVEITMIKMKKARQKNAVLTPFRCQHSSECAKSSFCRFVNPLTTRLPVAFKQGGEAEAS